MKCKKMIIPFIAILIVGTFITASVIQNKNGCDTVENRELRLREISNLGEATTIDQELTIDGYIVSGYTAKDNRHGLAFFVPIGNGKYEFQTNVNRQNNRSVSASTTIDQTHYDVFWANKADLDFAEITYIMDGKANETMKIDAQNNQIIYSQAPSRDYSVEYSFVDINGVRYE